jgi:hypothetical protein
MVGSQHTTDDCPITIETLELLATVETVEDIPPKHHCTTQKLRDIAMAKVLDELLACSPNELPELPDRAALLSDLSSALGFRLYAVAGTLSTSKTAAYLLHKAIRKDRSQTIDLSPFNLAENQIAYILFEQPAATKGVKNSSLSGNKYIQQPLLKRILQIYSSIDTLHMLNTPQIPLNAKLELLR